MASSLPTKPPNDGVISSVLWGWLKFVWQWIQGAANVTPSNIVSLTLQADFYYPFDATAGNLVATLPLANTCLGKKYLIKKTDASANTITVTASGTDLIDGATTKVISIRYADLEIVSDGVST